MGTHLLSLKSNLQKIQISSRTMKYVSAFLLAALSGNAPDKKQVTKVLESIGVEIDDAKLSKICEDLEGKDINEIIAGGMSKLATVSSGAGAAVAGGAAAEGGAQKAEEKEEEEEEEGSEASMDGGFDISEAPMVMMTTMTRTNLLTKFGRLMIWNG